MEAQEEAGCALSQARHNRQTGSDVQRLIEKVIADQEIMRDSLAEHVDSAQCLLDNRQALASMAGRSEKQKVIDNYASEVGKGFAIIGSILAAVVAISTFWSDIFAWARGFFTP
jgi:hypothetical protein